MDLSKDNNYKKLYVRARRTNKEQRTIYGFLRMAGCSRQQARQICCWTIPHILQYLKTRNLIVVGCKEKNCKVCPPLIKKLNLMDKEIFKMLGKYPDFTHERILKNIKIPLR
jgi:hypothetical protein